MVTYIKEKDIKVSTNNKEYQISYFQQETAALLREYFSKGSATNAKNISINVMLTSNEELCTAVLVLSFKAKPMGSDRIIKDKRFLMEGWANINDLTCTDPLSSSCTAISIMGRNDIQYTFTVTSVQTF
mgnify:CR=1 FL=1